MDALYLYIIKQKNIKKIKFVKIIKIHHIFLYKIAYFIINYKN